MSKEQESEYVKHLKAEAKYYIDKIKTGTEDEMKIFDMVYGFVRAGFLQSRTQKGSNRDKLIVIQSDDEKQNILHYSGEQVENNLIRFTRE